MWSVEVLSEHGYWTPWARHKGVEGWIGGGEVVGFRKQLAVQKAQRVMNIVDWAYGVRIKEIPED